MRFFLEGVIVTNVLYFTGPFIYGEDIKGFSSWPMKFRTMLRFTIRKLNLLAFSEMSNNRTHIFSASLSATKYNSYQFNRIYQLGKDS